MFKWFLIFYFKIFILKLVVPINTIRSKTFEHLREMKKGEKTNRAKLGHPVYETIGIVPTSNPLDPRWLFKRAVSLRVEFFNNPQNFFPGRWA